MDASPLTITVRSPKTLLVQIEETGEQLLTTVIDTIKVIDDEAASPTITGRSQTLTIAAVAKRLGFDLAAFDGSLIAHRAFCDVVKEGLYLTVYAEVNPEPSVRT